MDIYGWIQFALFLGVLLALTKPVGLYLVHVLDPERRTPVSRLVDPVERGLLRLMNVKRSDEQTWQRYAFSMLAFSAVSLLFTYAILRLQHLLPLNPQKLPAVPSALAFNTAVSFTTNTNWQAYAGETTMSYLSQMVALTFHNFASAAVGIAIAAALVRGIARRETSTVGNFWVDLVRINLHLLLPLSFVFALFLVSQGTLQNFGGYTTASTIEGETTQTIAQGPVASQVAIKMLGTNGGGFFNANAAHPFENSTPLSNFVQMISIFLIPSGLTYYLGCATKDQRHGWAVWSAMAALFIAGALACWAAEAHGNPRLHALGVEATPGNMEGKEVRFGVFNSALFATITTAASCGAVNSMHDSFTPLGGLAPLLNIQLGEVVFGGVGAGLYGMLVFVILTVFLAGLMIGRTPEYLGKKIDAFDVKAAALAILILTFSILGFSAWASVSDWGVSSRANEGPHGLTEILYAYSSATGNNGSAFAGLNANTNWYNTTLGIAMLLGRFAMIVPILALAGNMARKRLSPTGKGSFPVSGPTFAVLLVATVVLVGALTFLPALSLGPVLEHFTMVATKTTF
ncbi:MAG: potassium-transporting ATPase subunit KdpA [Candidatus Hydrogenedentes bacterium]|nr:potassium-transporting ATPase subunit KdpA [Candidatus Hydrogenedentota bacterium]